MIAPASADNKTLLRTYLNDHLAGAQLGVSLARQIADRQTDPAARARTDAIAEAVEEDRAVLRRLISELDMAQAKPKELLAGLLQNLTRVVKLNSAFGRCQLSALEEWEMLAVGIEGKRRLWTALQQVADAWPPVADLDLAGLIRRAEEQIAAVEQERLAAARSALGR